MSDSNLPLKSCLAQPSGKSHSEPCATKRAKKCVSWKPSSDSDSQSENEIHPNLSPKMKTKFGSWKRKLPSEVKSSLSSSSVNSAFSIVMKKRRSSASSNAKNRLKLGKRGSLSHEVDLVTPDKPNKGNIDQNLSEAGVYVEKLKDLDHSTTVKEEVGQHNEIFVKEKSVCKLKGDISTDDSHEKAENVAKSLDKRSKKLELTREAGNSGCKSRGQNELACRSESDDAHFTSASHKQKLIKKNTSNLKNNAFLLLKSYQGKSHNSCENEGISDSPKKFVEGGSVVKKGNTQENQTEIMCDIKNNAASSAKLLKIGELGKRKQRKSIPKLNIGKKSMPRSCDSQNSGNDTNEWEIFYSEEDEAEKPSATLKGGKNFTLKLKGMSDLGNDLKQTKIRIGEEGFCSNALHSECRPQTGIAGSSDENCSIISDSSSITSNLKDSINITEKLENHKEVVQECLKINHLSSPEEKPPKKVFPIGALKKEKQLINCSKNIDYFFKPDSKADVPASSCNEQPKKKKFSTKTVFKLPGIGDIQENNFNKVASVEANSLESKGKKKSNKLRSVDKSDVQKGFVDSSAKACKEINLSTGEKNVTDSPSTAQGDLDLLTSKRHLLTEKHKETKTVVEESSEDEEKLEKLTAKVQLAQIFTSKDVAQKSSCGSVDTTKENMLPAVSGAVEIGGQDDPDKIEGFFNLECLADSEGKEKHNIKNVEPEKFTNSLEASTKHKKQEDSEQIARSTDEHSKVSKFSLKKTPIAVDSASSLGLSGAGITGTPLDGTPQKRVKSRKIGDEEVDEDVLLRTGPPPTGSSDVCDGSSDDYHTETDDTTTTEEEKEYCDDSVGKRKISQTKRRRSRKKTMKTTKKPTPDVGIGNFSIFCAKNKPKNLNNSDQSEYHSESGSTAKNKAEAQLPSDFSMSKQKTSASSEVFTLSETGHNSCLEGKKKVSKLSEGKSEAKSVDVSAKSQENLISNGEEKRGKCKKTAVLTCDKEIQCSLSNNDEILPGSASKTLRFSRSADKARNYNDLLKAIDDVMAEAGFLPEKFSDDKEEDYCLKPRKASSMKKSARKKSSNLQLKRKVLVENFNEFSVDKSVCSAITEVVNFEEVKKNDEMKGGEYIFIDENGNEVQQKKIEMLKFGVSREIDAQQREKVSRFDERVCSGKKDLVNDEIQICTQKSNNPSKVTGVQLKLNFAFKGTPKNKCSEPEKRLKNKSAPQLHADAAEEIHGREKNDFPCTSVKSIEILRKESRRCSRRRIKNDCKESESTAKMDNTKVDDENIDETKPRALSNQHKKEEENKREEGGHQNKEDKKREEEDHQREREEGIGLKRRRRRNSSPHRNSHTKKRRIEGDGTTPGAGAGCGDEVQQVPVTSGSKQHISAGRNQKLAPLFTRQQKSKPAAASAVASQGDHDNKDEDDNSNDDDDDDIQFVECEETEQRVVPVCVEDHWRVLFPAHITQAAALHTPPPSYHLLVPDYFPTMKPCALDSYSLPEEFQIRHCGRNGSRSNWPIFPSDPENIRKSVNYVSSCSFRSIPTSSSDVCKKITSSPNLCNEINTFPLDDTALCKALIDVQVQSPKFPVLSVFKQYLNCKRSALQAFKDENTKKDSEINRECVVTLDVSANSTGDGQIKNESVEELKKTATQIKSSSKQNTGCSEQPIDFSHQATKTLKRENSVLQHPSAALCLSTDDSKSEKIGRKRKRSCNVLIDEAPSPSKVPKSTAGLQTSVDQEVEGNSDQEVRGLCTYSPAEVCRALVPVALPDLFAPSAAEHVMGNEGTVAWLRMWLQKWKQKCKNQQTNSSSSTLKRKKRKKMRSNTPGRSGWPLLSADWLPGRAGRLLLDADWSCDCSYDSDDSCGNTVLLIGPSGCGKTAIVYALAREFGYQVLEVNASSRRTSKTINNRLLEATQSQSIDQTQPQLRTGTRPRQQESRPGLPTLSLPCSPDWLLQTPSNLPPTPHLCPSKALQSPAILVPKFSQNLEFHPRKLNKISKNL